MNRLVHRALSKAAHPEQALLEGIHLFFEVPFHPLLFLVHELELQFVTPADPPHEIPCLILIGKAHRTTKMRDTRPVLSETPGNVRLRSRIGARRENLASRAVLVDVADEEGGGGIA